MINNRHSTEFTVGADILIKKKHEKMKILKSQTINEIPNNRSIGHS